MQQAPLPFAVTRGAAHTLVYANSAFWRLAGIGDGKALGAPIASAFATNARRALTSILDRAFREGVGLLDERIADSSEGATGWQCSVWPLVAKDGRAEALGVEIRESTPPDAALDLQREVAEQMLLGALRERGLAEDAEAARRRAAFLAEAGRRLQATISSVG